MAVPNEYPTQDQIAEIVKEMDRLAQGAAASDSYRDARRAVIVSVHEIYDRIEALVQRWRDSELKSAAPGQGDPDDYVRPMITLAELLRRLDQGTLARQVYEATDRAITATKPELHRGAIYANLGIIHLESGQYQRGLAHLHAAADQDTRLGRPASYALTDAGIFGQWIKSMIYPHLPQAALVAVEQATGVKVTSSEFLAFVRWLSAQGDVQLFSGVLEYAGVGALADVHSQSTRYSCLRDLAGLFEIVIKLIAEQHQDAAVAALFQSGRQPTLAACVCFMHYTPYPQRATAAKPMPASPDLPGPLWNTAFADVDLVQSVRKGFAAATGSTGALLAAQAASALSGKQSHDVLAKLILVAYHLRNLTSHAFHPLAADLVGNYNRLWADLLAATLGLFYWARETKQITQ